MNRTDRGFTPAQGPPHTQPFVDSGFSRSLRDRRHNTKVLILRCPSSEARLRQHLNIPDGMQPRFSSSNVISVSRSCRGPPSERHAPQGGGARSGNPESRLQACPPPQRAAAVAAGRLPALAWRWNRLPPARAHIPIGGPRLFNAVGYAPPQRAAAVAAGRLPALTRRWNRLQRAPSSKRTRVRVSGC
jgi:hypothetical protein